MAAETCRAIVGNTAPPTIAHDSRHRAILMDSLAVIATGGAIDLQTIIAQVIPASAPRPDMTTPAGVLAGGIDSTAGNPMGTLPRMTAPLPGRDAIAADGSASFKPYRQADESGITCALRAIIDLHGTVVPDG